MRRKMRMMPTIFTHFQEMMILMKRCLLVMTVMKKVCMLSYYSILNPLLFSASYCTA